MNMAANAFVISILPTFFGFLIYLGVGHYHAIEYAVIAGVVVSLVAWVYESRDYTKSWLSSIVVAIVGTIPVVAAAFFVDSWHSGSHYGLSGFWWIVKWGFWSAVFSLFAGGFIGFLLKDTEKAKLMSSPESSAAASYSTSSGEFGFRPRRARFTYEDVDGMSELKQELDEALQRFETEGGNGILLFGEPGNGKTFIAEAFAGQHNFRFLEARVTEMASKWVNETPEKIKSIFGAAVNGAPVVLFLDEVDSLLKERGTMNANAEDLKAANALLTAIADMNKGFSKHRVLVMAATNFIDKLDPAGIREGRFDVKIEVKAPDFEARKGILLRQLKKHRKIDMEGVERAVKRWEGFSVVRMIAIGKMADRMAREQRRPIDFDLLMDALREVQGRSGQSLGEHVMSLKDLTLAKAQREKLEFLLKFMTDRDYVDLYGGEVPKGAIFFGPPGTGKTTVAQALAKDSGWAFFATSGPEIVRDPTILDDVIRKAKDQRPAIVFIDEAEDLLADRRIAPHTSQITNKLLAMMDGPQKLHDVLFIAATNHPDDVDPALMRWGRFSELVDFTPSPEVYLEMVNAVIGQYRDNPLVRIVGDPAGYAHRLANDHYSPADVSGVVKKAIAEKAVTAGKGEVIEVNLDELP
ncbi:AAA family ATPase [Alcanivorax sp.]|uniref:AAA family ATPase n=1 Tax=Alcanivorax sp. TaxID=1872427 RepID=UPI002589B89E|nr:AAA family ATPase [Alcanivorax sp.]